MRDTTDGDFFAGVLFGQHVSRLFIQTWMIDASLFDDHAHKGWVEPQLLVWLRGNLESLQSKGIAKKVPN